MKKIIFNEHLTIRQLNTIEFTTEEQVRDFIEKLEIGLPNETELISVEYFYQIAIGNMNDYVSYKVWNEGGYWHSTDYYDGTEYSGYSDAQFTRVNGTLRDVFVYATKNNLINFTITQQEDCTTERTYVSVPNREVVYK